MGSKGGGSAPAQRALTQQELDLLDTQRYSLEQATEVAAKQFNLSNEDREYVGRIYRGDLNPDDPRVQAEVVRRLEATPRPTQEQFKHSGFFGIDMPDVESYEKAVKEWEDNKEALIRKVSQELGTKGVDELLFEAIKESKGESARLLNEWEAKATELGKTYTDTLTGISDKFRTTLETKSAELGTADTDIYSRTKAQNLAGISQAYAEARKQAEGDLARRGLAGSGVQAGVTSSLLGQEAQMKGQAFGQAYEQAVGMSDARRMQQVGIAGQVAQADTATAGSIYQTGMGLATSNLQNRLANQQQYMANLQMGSGISQGIYGLSQNYLSGAGSTATQVASIAGSTASAYGQMDNQYQMQRNEMANEGGLFGSIVSGGIGAMTGGIGTGMGAALAKKWG